MYDPRVKSDRNLHQDSFDTLKSKLSSALPSSCFFLFHGMNPCPPQGQSQHVEEEIISINSGFEQCSSTNLFQRPVVNTNDIAFNEFYDISSKVFKNDGYMCSA